MTQATTVVLRGPVARAVLASRVGLVGSALTITVIFLGCYLADKIPHFSYLTLVAGMGTGLILQAFDLFYGWPVRKSAEVKAFWKYQSARRILWNLIGYLAGGCLTVLAYLGYAGFTSMPIDYALAALIALLSAYWMRAALEIAIPYDVIV